MHYYMHRVMMRNELRGGRGAYEMSNAELGASGPSFGPFQYDIGGNKRGRALLESIAEAATDEHGARIIGDEELASIKQHFYKPFGQFSADETALYAQMKPAIDQALSSKAGVQAINEDYLPALDAKVGVMDAIADGIQNESNKNFVQNSPVAKLMLLDTANQYGPPVNNALKAFLDAPAGAPPITMPGRKVPATVQVDGELGLKDLIRFKLETQYGQTDRGASDALRRISNIVDAVGVDEVRSGLSLEDRQFLETGLANYLREHGRDLSMLQKPELSALAQVGGWTAEHDKGLQADGRTPVLKQGSRGKEVEELQTQLSELGYTDLQGNPLTPDKDFGPSTKAAVEAFQRDHGLHVDGVAGEDTFAALDEQVRVLGNAHTTTPSSRCPARLDDPAHPDHTFYLRTRELVYQLDQQNGRTPDHRSDQLASALIIQARTEGLQRIDQIALSEDASALWGAQRPAGIRDHFYDRLCNVNTVEALNSPMEQSGAQWQQAMQQFQGHQERDRQQQSVQQEQSQQQTNSALQR